MTGDKVIVKTHPINIILIICTFFQRRTNIDDRQHWGRARPYPKADGEWYFNIFQAYLKINDILPAILLPPKESGKLSYRWNNVFQSMC